MGHHKRYYKIIDDQLSNKPWVIIINERILEICLIRCPINIEL